MEALSSSSLALSVSEVYALEVTEVWLLALFCFCVGFHFCGLSPAYGNRLAFVFMAFCVQPARWREAAWVGLRQERVWVISIARLRTLPPVHLQPIYVVVCNDPYMEILS